MKYFIEQLTWRRAVKEFIPNKKIDEATVKKILNAVRMTPCGLGLQPYYLKVITDKPTLEKLALVGYGQKQFLTCSHLLVFVTRTDINKRIDEMLAFRSGGDSKKLAGLAAYEKMARGSVGAMSEDEAKVWGQKQIYIALGFAMAACAELEVDSCPMEGFEPEEFDKVLKLPKGHYSSVLLTLGVRHPENGAPYPQQRPALEEFVK